MIPRHSLALRLLAGAALWSLVVLIAGGLILSANYRRTAELNFETRLQALLDGLIATTELRNGALTSSAKLSETRFDFVYSGWYWQVTPVGETVDGEPILRSRSLFDESLPLPDQRPAPERGDIRFRTITGPVGQNLKLAERHVKLPGDEKGFLFTVGGDRAALLDETQSFNRTLAASLALLGLGLLIALVIQVRFGLRPLDQVRQELTAIRSGRKAKLEGQFPAEIEPLVDEINQLIDGNREVVERARTHASNLAHALKTPLTVLSNEAQQGSGPLAEHVKRQTELMREQVARHLSRAQTAASSRSSGLRTEVLPVAESLERTLARIYRERDLVFDLDVPSNLVFAGEEHDFQEMIGNLMDNACKWANQKVRLKARLDDPDERGRPLLRIAIADDGPGLTAEERREVLKRGTRLDERVPGDGLGLSIVTEVADLYGGSLQLARSGEGGLLAILRLPAVPPDVKIG